MHINAVTPASNYEARPPVVGEEKKKRKKGVKGKLPGMWLSGSSL